MTNKKRPLSYIGSPVRVQSTIMDYAALSKFLVTMATGEVSPKVYPSWERLQDHWLDIRDYLSIRMDTIILQDADFKAFIADLYKDDKK